MQFSHADDIWRDFPELVPGVLFAQGIDKHAEVAPALAKYRAVAADKLARSSESVFAEIQAWRRAFSRMGLKPTQYRCASEALLRRFRQEHALPQIHPLVDLCNAVSLAFAIPIAVLDAARIVDNLQVRYATGDERYLNFSSEIERPDSREVIFADDAGNAHARRWTNRQSARSVVRDDTAAVLIVAEAMHASAQGDMERLIAALSGELAAMRSTLLKSAVLTRHEPAFTV